MVLRATLWIIISVITLKLLDAIFSMLAKLLGRLRGIFLWPFLVSGKGTPRSTPYM